MSTDVEEYPICPCLNLIELKLILVHFSAFQYVLFQSTSRALGLVVLYSLSSTFLFCFTERNAIMLLLVVVLVTKLQCGPSVQRRKVCLMPTTRCRAVTLPRRKTR